MEKIEKQLENYMKEWKQKMPEVKYFLVILQEGKEPLVSHATKDYRDLLDPKNAPENEDEEALTPRDIIKMELFEENQVGIIYEKKDDEYVVLDLYYN